MSLVVTPGYPGQNEPRAGHNSGDPSEPARQLPRDGDVSPVEDGEIDPMHSGIRVDNIDPTVRPQDDLFGHVNGRWVAGTEIPADRGRYGSFDILREEAEVQLPPGLEKFLGR